MQRVIRRQRSIVNCSRYFLNQFQRTTTTTVSNNNSSMNHHSFIGDPDSVVLVERNAYSRTVILNRPSFLNALNTSMVAILDGVTIGGGAGVAIPGTFWVATDKTAFATPETSIGLHPDAGASFHLSRLPGYLGEHLGLTGNWLNGVEMIGCGLAKHYSDCRNVPEIEECLKNLITDDPSVVETCLENYSDLELKYPDNNSVLKRMEMVDKCFCHDILKKSLMPWNVKLQKLIPVVLFNLEEAKLRLTVELEGFLEINSRIAVSDS